MERGLGPCISLEKLLYVRDMIMKEISPCANITDSCYKMIMRWYIILWRVENEVFTSQMLEMY